MIYFHHLKAGNIACSGEIKLSYTPHIKGNKWVIYEGRLKSSEPDQVAGIEQPWNFEFIKSKPLLLDLTQMRSSLPANKVEILDFENWYKHVFEKMDKIWHRCVIKYLP